MTFRAKLFVGLILALGTATAVIGGVSWTSSGLGTFATFFVLCVGTSLLRVVLPGVQGNLSLSYVFLIWGIAHLGLGETVLMGIVSAVVQSYWRCAKKPRLVQVAFNLALISLSVGVGKLVFSSSLVQSLAPSELIRTVLASVVLLSR